MDQEDSGILALFACDEEKAFKQMFDLYYADFCVVARLFTGSQVVAEDIVQQVFVGFWEQKCQTRINSTLKGYLQTSVRNACVNYLHKQKNVEKKQSEIIFDEVAVQALDFLLNKEEQKVIAKAVSELPDQCRKVFELIYFDELPYKAAAVNLHLSVNTVKSHLKNALRILKSNSRLKSYYLVKK